MRTINDIAKAAGVSPATVSKAFNDYKDVSDKTKEKIFKIADEHGYFPNHSASQLVTGAEDTIGVILSMIGRRSNTDEFLLGIISGIYNYAEAHSYRVAMFTAQAITDKRQNYVQFCRSNNMIGTIVHGLVTTDPELPRLVESEVPCVFIDNNLEGKKTATISVDNEKASAEVIDKLAGLGHRHIVYVSGSPLSTVSLDRQRGYIKGMERNGALPVNIIQSNFYIDEAYEKVKAYILDYPDVTAFFCASDLMAVGALNACLDLRYRVPDDISIMGFDDLSVTKYVRPQLSTVCQDFFEMGSNAAELLVAIYNGIDVPKHFFLDYTLKMRQSVTKKI